MNSERGCPVPDNLFFLSQSTFNMLSSIFNFRNPCLSALIFSNYENLRHAGRRNPCLTALIFSNYENLRHAGRRNPTFPSFHSTFQ